MHFLPAARHCEFAPSTPAYAAPGMVARHKKLVDIARRLQVGKAFNAMQPSTSATHGRLARKRSDHCKASYSAGVQACNCVGGVVLAGELVDGGVENGAQGGLIVGAERADVHGGLAN